MQDLSLEGFVTDRVDFLKLKNKSLRFEKETNLSKLASHRTLGGVSSGFRQG